MDGEIFGMLPRARAGRAFVALSAFACAAVASVAHAVPVCGIPSPSATAFAQGDANTLRWTPGSPVGGGFTIEVAASSALLANGSLRDVVQTAFPSASATSRDFTGLDERAYWYHILARGNSTCTTSPWSPLVSTIQDATGPEITITTPPPSGPYVMSSVRLAGFAIDRPHGLAPTASGAKSVTVELDDTTPALGSLHDPIQQSIATDVDGSWSTTFNSLPLGTYTASVTGVDRVGNVSGAPATFNFVVVNAP